MRDGFRLPPLFTLLDVVLVLTVSAVSAGFYGRRVLSGNTGGPREVVLQLEDRELARLSLDRDSTLTVQGVLGPVTVVVADGAVRFRDASCAARICEKTGWVNRVGAAIVCAPNHLLARVARADGAETGAGLDGLSR